MNSLDIQSDSSESVFISVPSVQLEENCIKENDVLENVLYNHSIDETSEDDPIESVCEVTNEIYEYEETEEQDSPTVEETDQNIERNYEMCYDVEEKEPRETSYSFKSENKLKNPCIEESEFDITQTTSKNTKVDVGTKLLANHKIKEQCTISSNIENNQINSLNEKVSKNNTNSVVSHSESAGKFERSSSTCPTLSAISGNEAPGRIESRSGIKPVSSLVSPGKVKQSPSRWTPQINSVISVNNDSETTNSHSLFLIEDLIKQEEFSDEVEDHDNSEKNLESTNCDNHTNLKIEEEQFKMVNFCIKLEKIDCSHLLDDENTEKGSKHIVHHSKKLPNVMPTKIIKKKISKKKQFNTQTLCEKTSFKTSKKFKSKKKIKKNVAEGEHEDINAKRDRRSLRLLGKSPEKTTLSINEHKKRRLNVTFEEERNLSVDKKDARNSKCRKQSSEKILPTKKTFSLNESVSEKSTNISKSGEQWSENKKNNVTLNKNSGNKFVNQENIQPLKNYRKSMAVWYECLCCDQKYHLLDQIKEHVRSHFPGVHTS